MASYTADEGDSFDVTVTLSDFFENTRTLPVVVTPNGERDGGGLLRQPAGARLRAWRDREDVQRDSG